MVVRRSQGAGKPEQSSQRYAFLKGIPSWFALLLLLLGSLYFIPVILRNDLSSVICIVHAPQKERFSRRNQYNYYFNIPKTNRNLIRQCNRDSGEYGLKYHLATTISKTYRPCNGIPQIMPPRRAKEKIGDQTEHIGGVISKLSKKPTRAEIAAEDQKRKDRLLDEILMAPRWDPMGDRADLSSSESSGWETGHTSSSDSHDSDKDNKQSKPINSRRWETTVTTPQSVEKGTVRKKDSPIARSTIRPPPVTAGSNKKAVGSRSMLEWLQYGVSNQQSKDGDDRVLEEMQGMKTDLTESLDKVLQTSQQKNMFVFGQNGEEGLPRGDNQSPTLDQSELNELRDYGSPKHKEGNLKKRQQVQTPPITHRHREIQTPNTQSTPESLRDHYTCGKSKLTGDGLVETLEASQPTLPVENPYDQPPKITRFGGSVICEYDNQQDKSDLFILDSIASSEDEMSVTSQEHSDILQEIQEFEVGERLAVDVGGGGDCVYHVIADQSVCNYKFAYVFRAATAQYLRDNSSSNDIIDKNFMILGDEKSAATVEQYAARVATQGEYAGNVELAVLARLTNRRLIIYDRYGDQDKTRIIEVNDGCPLIQEKYYELEYDDKLQHYRSVQGEVYRERLSKLQINPKTFDVKALTFIDQHFTMTGRYIDSGGIHSGFADIEKMVKLQGGTLSKTVNKRTTAVIMGSNPSVTSINYCKSKGIPLIPYDILFARIRWEITSELMITLGSHLWKTFPSSPLTPARDTPSPIDLFKTTTGTEEPPPNDPFGFTSSKLHAGSTPKSSIKNSSLNDKIPINQAALSRMHLSEQSEDIGPDYNKRPSNVDKTETFISIAFRHNNDDEDNTSISIKSRFAQIVELIFVVDPGALINPVWNEEKPPPSINKQQDLPQEWISLQKYLYVNNPQTLGTRYVKDGVKQAQNDTYTTIRITSKVDTTHLLATLALNLSEMNVRMYIKQLPVLSSKSVLAIIGTHVEWNLPAMTEDFRQVIGDMVSKCHAEGYWDGQQQYHNRPPPFFVLKVLKMKAPKSRADATPQDRDFEETFHNLRQIIAIECPDDDIGWLVEVLEKARSDGLIKVLTSRRATIIALPNNSITSEHEQVHFSKSFRSHMILLATNSISQIPDVLTMKGSVKVEVLKGFLSPYKATNLKRELMSFRLAPTKDGKDGVVFIEGAQMVITGKGQAGGKVLLMHSNNPDVVTMISNYLSNPVAWTYWYIRQVKNFTERCAMKCISMWFINPLQVADTNFNISTNNVNSRVKSSHTLFEKDMKEAGCLEIPEYIRNDLDIRRKTRDHEESIQRLTEMFNFTSDRATDFSCINSAASALTATSHTTNGNASLRSVNTEMVNRQLTAKREERCRLMMRLREIDPNHSIFKEAGYNDEEAEYFSDDSVDAVGQSLLYNATRSQINRLNLIINHLETEGSGMTGDDTEMGGEKSTGAHASKASEEATTGTPPRLRGSATPTGTAALSSKAAGPVGGVQGS